MESSEQETFKFGLTCGLIIGALASGLLNSWFHEWKELRHPTTTQDTPVVESFITPREVRVFNTIQDAHDATKDQDEFLKDTFGISPHFAWDSQLRRNGSIHVFGTHLVISNVNVYVHEMVEKDDTTYVFPGGGPFTVDFITDCLIDFKGPQE